MRYIFALVSFAFATPVIAAEPPELASNVDELVQPYLDAEIVNAVSIGIVQGDKEWTRHYGQLSEDQKQLPDDSTLYELGSISKVFTGILLADAVVSERVRLDDSIGDLLPVLKTKNKDVGDSIQLRHLSTHVSGLPRLPGNLKPADPTNPYAEYDRERMVDYVSSFKPRRKPGEKGEYSNLAVGLLGQLLSIEAQQSYEHLLKHRIGEPLKMSETSVVLNADQQSRLAPPHSGDRRIDRNWDLGAFEGAGGIHSNTTDMLRFIKAQLNPSDDRLGKAIELAWREQLPSRDGAFAMGLGWHIAHDGETRWHNGQTGGYHTAMFVDRRINTGIIVLCNTATGEIDALAESIIQTLAGMKVEPRSFPKEVKVSAKTVSRLAGKYKIAPTFALTVRADGEKLYVKATNQSELRVFPLSETKWQYRVVDAQLTFDLPETGPCKSVTLHQNGIDMPGPRQTE